jgi:hypothetical protein
MDIASKYEYFSTMEARGNSRCYEEWAAGIASDNELLALIRTLPDEKQQPNLILASARYVGIEQESFSKFREDFIESWESIRAVAMKRRTQTNEVGRCATLLPILCGLQEPLALLEVGASAGLCLYPDHYNYQYNDDAPILSTTAGGPLLRCTTSGDVPFPVQVPQIVWRAGIDLNPIDVKNQEDTDWLQFLIWPEQQHRIQRLQAALSIVRTDPPILIRGDLLENLEATAASCPSGATLVIFHSAVLNYIPSSARIQFQEVVNRLPAHWISNEGEGVIDYPGHKFPPQRNSTTGSFVMALDGFPLAYTGPHGDRLDWF